MDELAHSMDFCSINNHVRTIIHIDIDCFYAQVEMIKNPSLRGCPLGVQQKNIIVTSNYVAREFGIKKCMLVSEGLKLCPQLVLVRGEDLSDYRQVSAKITSLLHKFSSQVEKLGLDENFVDVTNLVSERLEGSCSYAQNVTGCVYGDLDEKCECGCRNRLCVGSHIASEIRSEIKDVLGITCCAGIAHNKLLAKLVCATHKPNDQTTIFPCNALALLSNLENVRSIPGIGHCMYETLQSLGISSVGELRNCNLTSLQKALGNDIAIRIKKLSYGIDDSPVKPTGKPQSIGLEDGFRKISLESEVKDKLATLLHRLIKLLSQDSRIPGSIRVTVRKYDSTQKYGHRESRQCNIAPSFFKNNTSNGSNPITPKSTEKLMALIMQLFHKMVNISKPFHLTLLGLAFTKFQERKTGRSSIASFLTNDISVQSVLSFKSVSTGAEKMEYSSINSSPLINMERSGSESEPEPSPKKTRTDIWIPRCKKRLSTDDDECVPNKRLSENSAGCSVDRYLEDFVCSTQKYDKEQESGSMIEESTSIGVSEFFESSPSNSSEVEKMENESNFLCPDDVDTDVFNALPQELKEELLEEWNKRRRQISPVPHSRLVTATAKPKQKSILQFCISNK
ncbi:DNA polymerase iota [Periplaneta americana]|uniref:DNA polymerase iota n=1 Tax=Periplaneta americana TaxID=6978 RepID=UPI0037E7B54D